MPGKISFIQPNITSLFPGKTPFQEGSFMKVNYILLISLLIVGAIFVPAVSADDIIIDEQIGGWADTSGQYTLKFPGEGSSTLNMKYIAIRDIALAQTLNFVTVTFQGNKGSLNTGEYPITYVLGGVTKSGTLYVTKYNNVLGQVTHTRFQIFFHDWDIGNLQGHQVITLNRTLWTGSTTYALINNWKTSVDSNIIMADNVDPTTIKTCFESMDTVYVSGIEWKNHLIVTHNDDDSYKVDLQRLINSKHYTSTLTVKNISDSVTYTVYGSDDVWQFFYPNEISTISVISPSNDTYIYNIRADIPGTNDNYPVTVYAQNGDTGALIADTDLSILLDGSSTWYNSTLEWGWDTIELPAGNYEFYAEKSGYTQYAPSRLTVDGIGDDVGMFLYPNVETPPAGNITLDFWICDTNNNGIPYAELSVMGLAGEGADYNSGILETNQLGYVSLTVLGNSTYLAYASKPGYTPGENEFGVTTYTPLHIAIRLLGGEVPTNPTPTQPGVTPTVTPTVRPTDVASGNNPIDNFRIMFLNMGFDDNYTDWLTGLFIICIGAALGYCLVKKVGAMCGAPIGLLTAVGLRLIPIWALVLIIVIVALAYAKYFMGR